MTRRECRLLSLSEVVINISVEDKLSDGNKGIISVGNNFSDIEEVPSIVEAVSLRDSLNGKLPFCSFSGIQMVDEISLRIIRISHEVICLLSGKIFDS